ncbi:MAG TPA: SRPBCC family protein [Vicinamibacterales bacterium]|nr:SRPBCC family protein [Vicinamibacterales bacterium]
MKHDYRNEEKAEQLALGLGWFSIGLGLVELMAPQTLARAIGMPGASPTVLRAFGAREIGAGLAILNEPDRATWLWSRVGGDAVDLSYLASGLADHNNKTRIAIAMAAVAGVTALDVLCAQELRQLQESPASRRTSAADRGAVHIERVITINRGLHEVYQFWRRFENFPRFMPHVESVEMLSERRSRWRAKAPAGMTVEWEAELLEDREDEWIAWQSVPGSGIENSGSVRFSPAPGARGTEVRVQLQYNPPAGAIGRNIAWLFGEEPAIQIHDDLRRFKQIMETGEVPLSDGPALWRAAQPGDPQKIRSLAGVRP